jgi:hypothetical protein
MARPSTIANHPRRHEIEQALAGNEPLRRISARFGASVTALHRHRHALATGCNKGTAIPSAAPSTGVRVGNTPAPDPFDILDAHYPWNGETPRPGPLAEVLRQQQRQHGTAGVRTAAFSIIAQHQFTGLTDTAIGRQLDVSPAHVAAWRVEQEREQLARLSRDPRSILARELAALDQREQQAWQKLSTTGVGSRAWSAAQATLNQVARQRRLLREEAGISLTLPNPPEPPGRSTTPLTDRGATLAAVLQREVADLLVNGAGISPECTLDEGLDQFKEILEKAWAAEDAAADPEPAPSR